MKLSKKLSIIFLLVVSIISFSGCDFKSEKTNDVASDTIKVGVVGENNEQWKVIIEELAKENIKLELIKFSDYILPNQALQEGEIDLNAFQHYAFLENEILEKGYEISPIGNTIIAPLGLYSKKIKSIDEIKEGDQIAIPNDVVNGGRALKLLEVVGLITVNPDKGFSPSISDIITNPHKLKFIEVEAAQTPSLLPDVCAAIINASHAVDAGLNPEKDSIAIEKTTGGAENPFVNIIAARTIDKDNKTYKKVVEAYHSDKVKNIIENVYKGAYLIGW